MICIIPFNISASVFPDPSEQKPNIVFIVVDDLRPELSCYGHSKLYSPNIDRLADQGILFEQAYCQVPVCGASRASVLTGLRPSRNRFVDFKTRADTDAPHVIDLPGYMKSNGYYTISNGKVYHHNNDRLDSWSEKPWRPDGDWAGRGYVLMANKLVAQTSPKGLGPAYEKANVTDDVYPDGKITAKTIADLRRLKNLDKPFFLAVGYLKPHLPFNAPSRYWDLYERADIEPVSNPYKPKDAPDAALHNWGELRQYQDIPKTGPLPENLARTLVHGYYACVSYTDAQIGHLLDELERLDLIQNTIIVLWGDHGWNLGEHGLWCKHCNFETSLRAPLIIKIPGQFSGRKISTSVEFVDLYPSLCDLLNLRLPDHLQGKSLIDLINNSNSRKKQPVYSRYFDGESVKLDQYRYTEWIDHLGNRYAQMLYDHYLDPGENVNVVDLPDYADQIDKMRFLLENERRNIGHNKNTK